MIKAVRQSRSTKRSRTGSGREQKPPTPPTRPRHPESKTPYERAFDVDLEPDSAGLFRLRDFADGLRRGEGPAPTGPFDADELEKIKPPRVKKGKPGLPLFRAKKVAGLEVAEGSRSGDDYLANNRFDWWESMPPPTGPIPIPTGVNSAFVAINEHEFDSPLTTVAGCALNRVNEVPDRRLIPWDPGRDGASPNETPGIEFTLRNRRPRSRPVLRDRSITVGSGIQSCPVIVNEHFAGYQLDGTETWPPLRIEFAVPQRAVALEYGFLSDDGNATIRAKSFRLIARDREEREIVTALGRDFGLGLPTDAKVRPLVRANSGNHVIGLRDESGEIASVELFYELRDPAIRTPQFVLRIWHEALPPAAVLQIVLDEGELASHKLPFRCNKYVVATQGFFHEFTDDQVHAITGLRFGVTGVEEEGRWVNNLKVETTLAIKSTVGMTVQHAGEEPAAPPTDRQTAVSILAWDSEQVDLNVGDREVIEGSDETWGVEVDETGGLEWLVIGLRYNRPEQWGRRWRSRLIAQDPCPSPVADNCGPVAAFVDWFDCSIVETDLTAAGLQYMELVDMAFHFDSPERGIHPIFDYEGNFTGATAIGLHWFYGYAFRNNPLPSSSARGSNRYRVKGHVLTGTSLVPGQRYGGGPYSFYGVPLSAGAVIGPPPGWQFEGPVDMAFVGMHQATLYPNGPFKGVALGLDGRSFDGRKLLWQVQNVGVSNQAKDDYFGTMAWPRTIGVVRRSLVAAPRLVKLDVHFDGAAMRVRTGSPRQHGFIRNDGNFRVVLSDMRYEGPNTEEFVPKFLYRYLFRSVASVAYLLPLELDPGESIVIGGSFTPLGAYENPPAQARLVFTTNDPNARELVVEITGTAGAGNAQAELDEDNWSFQPGEPTFHWFELTSTASDRLVIDAISFDDPADAFTFEITTPGWPRPVRPDEDPPFFVAGAGGRLRIQIWFTPPGPGTYQGALRFETSAGPQVINVTGASPV